MSFGRSGAAGCRTQVPTAGAETPRPVSGGRGAERKHPGRRGKQPRAGQQTEREARRGEREEGRRHCGQRSRSSVPRNTPSATANAAYPTGTISRESNDPNWLRPARSSGPVHQVTGQLASPATAMAASPETASRMRQPADPGDVLGPRQPERAGLQLARPPTAPPRTLRGCQEPRPPGRTATAGGCCRHGPRQQRRRRPRQSPREQPRSAHGPAARRARSSGNLPQVRDHQVIKGCEAGGADQQRVPPAPRAAPVRPQGGSGSHRCAPGRRPGARRTPL